MLTIKKTDELSSSELIEIMKQRVAVFVVEQNCPYQEVDDADFNDWHVILHEQEKIQAYARVIDKGDYVTFGRVLVAEPFRGQGLGRQIVSATLEMIANNFTGCPIKIQAQAYLQKFYESFGFQATSAVYLEDDIPHLDMQKIN
ncbi:GNAT family N-acetyltransferase [Lentilactobacillus senioris]|uniref:GNAT family N-acetyltransferase n=1 Tax=Lentilactobacillus senioris TaxID=931534 RepID=UPI003D27EF90